MNEIEIEANVTEDEDNYILTFSTSQLVNQFLAKVENIKSLGFVIEDGNR